MNNCPSQYYSSLLYIRGSTIQTLKLPRRMTVDTNADFISLLGEFKQLKKLTLLGTCVIRKLLTCCAFMKHLPQLEELHIEFLRFIASPTSILGNGDGGDDERVTYPNIKRLILKWPVLPDDDDVLTLTKKYTGVIDLTVSIWNSSSWIQANRFISSDVFRPFFLISSKMSEILHLRSVNLTIAVCSSWRLCTKLSVKFKANEDMISVWIQKGVIM